MRRTQDYGLTTYGAAIGVADRVEVSLARQQFDAGVVVPGTTLKLDIVGVKLKVAGDAVLDSDRWMPQIAAGLEWKRVDPGAAVGGVLDSVSARRSGVDLYINATKLFLAQQVLVNGTLRATKANQNGLLGFGSSRHRGYRLEPEVSLAYLLHKSVAIGAEYRAKPNHLAYAGAAVRRRRLERPVHRLGAEQACVADRSRMSTSATSSATPTRAAPMRRCSSAIELPFLEIAMHPSAPTPAQRCLPSARRRHRQRADRARRHAVPAARLPARPGRAGRRLHGAAACRPAHGPVLQVHRREGLQAQAGAAAMRRLRRPLQDEESGHA